MTTDLSSRPIDDGHLEAALRGAFRTGAERLPATVDPWSRTTRAVRRDRVRRQTAALAVAASVALVGVLGATGGLPLDRADRPQVADRVGGSVTTDDVTRWPVRGERAGDAAYLAAVRERLVTAGTVEAVLYAGRVRGRWVGVGVVRPAPHTDSGSPAGDVPHVVAVLDVDAGDAGKGTLVDGAPEPWNGVVSMALQDAEGAIDLLVLARTDASTVAVSAAPRFDAQGVPFREFLRLDARDGVAVTRLPPGSVSALSVLTALPDARPVAGPLTAVVSTLRSPDVDPARLAAVAAQPQCAGRIDAQDVQNAVSAVIGNYDPLHQPAAIEALWCRDVGDGGQVGLFAVTRSDGTTLLTTHRSGTARDGSWLGAFDASSSVVAVPRGKEASTPFVVGDVPDRTDPDRPDEERGRFFVHAPGAAAVRVVTGADPAVTVRMPGRPDADGFLPIELSRSDLTAMLEATDPQVVLLSASGKEIGRAPLFQDRQRWDDHTLVGPVR